MSTDDYAKIESLILEQMRQFRGELSGIKQEMSAMRGQMLIMSQHLAGSIGSQALHEAEIASVKDRLDRIEKRLELRDA